MERKLTRIPSEAVVGGVAAGMSDYFGIDRTIIRVLWVVLLLLPIPPTFFWTAIIYIIFWVALPEGLPGANSSTNVYDGDAGINPDPSAPGTRPPGFFANSSDPDRSIKIIGVVLLGVGAVLLLDELPYWYRIREYVWPVALIVGGAFLLLRQRDKEALSGTDSTPPPADPFTPRDTRSAEPFPPTEPDPVPYRPFDGPTTSTSVDPDAPADPDGETNPGSEPPIVR
ncbi:PspC domain-containing protein [Persicitalea sp.]|uniref:PspC domain-containing protein n=1 Tax=Persicitalea sp. TaxID=3100273 RepID=UPI00359463C9